MKSTHYYSSEILFKKSIAILVDKCQKLKQSFIHLLQDKEHRAIVKKICKNVEIFIKKNWKEYDLNICDELVETDDILKIDCKKIKTIILRYHIKTKMLYLFINHSVVGGGDYLLLGSVIFNGKINELISEPKNTFKDMIMTKLFKFHFMFDTVRLLYFKLPREKNKKSNVIKTIIDLNNIKIPFIKTKYVIINDSSGELT